MKLPSLCLSFLSVSVLFSTTTAQAATFTYSLIEIGTFDQNGSFSSVDALNNVGDAVVSSSGIDSDLLLRNGSLEDLGPLPEGISRVSATSINDNGQIAGFAATQNGGSVPFIWEDGQFTILPTIETGEERFESSIADINNSGQAVGVSAGRLDGQPVIWEDGSLNVLQGFEDEAGSFSPNAINDTGQIVGTTSDAQGTSATLWQNGQVVDLGAAENITGISDALDINNFGLTVGHAENEAGVFAAVWQDGVATFIDQTVDVVDSFGFPISTAHAVNNLGQVVGTKQNDAGNFAFIWDEESGLLNLENLIDPLLGWTLNFASDINDRGQITGFGLNADGEARGFLLTPADLSVPAPVPLPAGVSLLLAALASFKIMGRRRKISVA